MWVSREASVANIACMRSEAARKSYGVLAALMTACAHSSSDRGDRFAVSPNNCGVAPYGSKQAGPRRVNSNGKGVPGSSRVTSNMFDRHVKRRARRPTRVGSTGVRFRRNPFKENTEHESNRAGCEVRWLLPTATGPRGTDRLRLLDPAAAIAGRSSMAKARVPFRQVCRCHIAMRVGA